MKKFTAIATALTLATGSMLVSTAATAEVSANVGATSNYLWRGLEQTGGGAAISGGIDYSSESGFYAGTWVSNASWDTSMTTELDLYGGFGADINDSMSYDVGFVYFMYPDAANDVDFSEIYGSFTFSGLTIGAAVLATADGSDFGDSLYVNADYGFALGSGELALHVGSYSGDFSTESVDFGVSYSKDSFTFGVSKTDYDDGFASDDLKFYVSYSVDIAL